jgi:hypothetical protein
MLTALIFKEQAKVKESGLREKGLAQPHYSIHHIEGYDLLCFKEKIYIPQSFRQTTKCKWKGPIRSIHTMTQGNSVRFCYFGWEKPIFLA